MTHRAHQPVMGGGEVATGEHRDVRPPRQKVESTAAAGPGDVLSAHAIDKRTTRRDAPMMNDARAIYLKKKKIRIPTRNTH